MKVGSDRVIELIYEAVRAAIALGVSPEDFKREAAESWRQCLKDDAEHASKVLEAKR